MEGLTRNCIGNDNYKSPKFRQAFSVTSLQWLVTRLGVPVRSLAVLPISPQGLVGNFPELNRETPSRSYGGGTWLDSLRAALTQTARHCGPSQAQGVRAPIAPVARKENVSALRAGDPAPLYSNDTRRIGKKRQQDADRVRHQHPEHYGFPFSLISMEPNGALLSLCSRGFFLFFALSFLLRFFLLPSERAKLETKPLPTQERQRAADRSLEA